MKNTNIIKGRNDMKALFEELKARFGTKTAREIIEQIRSTRATGSAPSYMLVKACSEMLELFRGNAQEKLAELRQKQRQWAQHGAKVTPFDKPALEADFRQIYRLYWISMKLFYPLFDQAMIEAQKPLFPTRSTTPQASGTPLCQAFAA